MLDFSTAVKPFICPGYVRRGQVVNVNIWAGGYSSPPSVLGSPDVKMSRD